MKKYLLLIITICTFLFCSCSKNVVTSIPSNYAVDTSNIYKEINDVKEDVNEVIIGGYSYNLEQGRVRIKANSTMNYKNNTYQFLYFATSYNNPLDLKDIPRYRYDNVLDEYSYLLPKNYDISTIYAYYGLRHNFYFKGFRREGGVTRELTKPNITHQTFYTTLDLDLAIPLVEFDSFNDFTYYSDIEFSTELLTFKDLDDSIKSSGSSIIYSLSLEDSEKPNITNFTYFDLFSYFDIDSLNNYVITRDSDKLNSLLDNREYLTYTNKSFKSYYIPSLNDLYVYFNGRLEDEGILNTYVIPRKVNSVDVSVRNDVQLFTDTYNFRAFFELSEATTIDLTGTNLSNITNTSHMFSNASNLKTINGLDSLNTASVSDMSYMFYKTSNLTNATISFDTTNLKDLAHMFNYSNISILNDTSFLDNVKPIDLKYAFANLNGASNSDFIVPTFDLTNTYDLRGLFKGISSIDEISFKDTGSSKVSLTDELFDGVLSINTLDFSNSHFKSGLSFTNSCYNADVTDLNFSNVLYSSVSTLLNLMSVTHFEIKNKVNFNSLDIDANLESSFSSILNKLTNLGDESVAYDLNNFNFSKKRVYLNSIFEGLTYGPNFDFSFIKTWTNTSNIWSLYKAFKDVKSTTDMTLDLSHMDFSDLQYLDYSFYNSNITYLNFDSTLFNTPGNYHTIFTTNAFYNFFPKSINLNNNYETGAINFIYDLNKYGNYTEDFDLELKNLTLDLGSTIKTSASIFSHYLNRNLSKRLDIRGLKLSQNISLNYLFFEIDIDRLIGSYEVIPSLDYSYATSLYNTFYHAISSSSKKLELDLSNLNTSIFTDNTALDQTFGWSNIFSTVTLSNLDLSNLLLNKTFINAFLSNINLENVKLLQSYNGFDHIFSGTSITLNLANNTSFDLWYFFDYLKKLPEDTTRPKYIRFILDNLELNTSYGFGLNSTIFNLAQDDFHSLKNFKVTNPNFPFDNMFYGSDLANYNLADLNTWDVKLAPTFRAIFGFSKTSKPELTGETLDLSNWRFKDNVRLTQFAIGCQLKELILSDESNPVTVMSTEYSIFSNYFTKIEARGLDLSTTSAIFDPWNIKYLAVKKLSITGLKYITDQLNPARKSNIEYFYLEEVVDDSNGAFVNLDNAFSFPNVKEFVLTNLEVSSNISLINTFKSFQSTLFSDPNAYMYTSDISNWKLTGETTLDSTFSEAFLRYTKADNWIISNLVNANKAFYKSLFYQDISNEVDDGFNYFDFATWTSGNLEDSIIQLPNESLLIFSSINQPDPVEKPATSRIRSHVSLTLSAFKYPSYDSVDLQISDSYISDFVLKDITGDELLQFFNLLVANSNDDYITSLNLDNLFVNNPLFNGFTNYFFTKGFIAKINHSIKKENRNKFSYKHWSFSEDVTNITGYFSVVEFFQEDLNTWDMTNVNNIWYLFYYAVIDQPITLNLRSLEVKARYMFFHSYIHVMPHINFVNNDRLSGNFTDITDAFNGVTAYIPLDLSDFPKYTKPSDSVFKYLAFSDSVEDKTFNISNWNILTNTDFLSYTTNITTIKLNNINIDSFLNVRSCLDYYVNDRSLRNLELTHLKLTGTASGTSGKQNFLLDGIHEKVAVKLDYLELEPNGTLESAFSNFVEGSKTIDQRGNLTVTDFSTWNFKVISLNAAFSRRGSTNQIYNFDFSNLDVSSCTNIDWAFDLSYISKLDTSNWNLSAISGTITGLFNQNFKFDQWIFNNMTLKPTQQYSRIWGTSPYSGTVPSGFPKPGS